MNITKNTLSEDSHSSVGIEKYPRNGNILENICTS